VYYVTEFRPIQILYCLLENKGGLKCVFSDGFVHMYQRNCKKIASWPNHCNLPVTVDNTKRWTSACHLACIFQMLHAQHMCAIFQWAVHCTVSQYK